MTDEVSCVYEDPALREALGDILRPGGLALTDEALAACGLPPARGCWMWGAAPAPRLRICAAAIAWPR